MMKSLIAIMMLLAVLTPAFASAGESTISLTSFRIGPNGTCEFVFTINGNSGIGYNYASCEDAVLDTLSLQSLEQNLVRFLVAYWVARNPTLSNPNVLLNKTLTIDFAVANPIKVQ